MHKTKNLLLPLVAIIIYVTLMLAFLSKSESIPTGQHVPIGLSLFAFSLALNQVFIALRPKFLERKLSLPVMYSAHGVMALILITVVFVHISIELTSQKFFTVLPTTKPAGIMALSFLIFTVFAGALSLSSIFVRKSKTLMRMKDSVFKREVGLWIHRLSILAVLAIFSHMMSVDFVRSNTLLSILSGFYVLLAVGGYAASKIAKKNLPRYILRQASPQNSSVFELEFEPQEGSLMPYNPGQYVFVRFVKSKLPKESHPFSVSSAPSKRAASLKVLVKSVGDYTSMMNKLEKGDIATLEGPYGIFMDKNTAHAENPIVMLAAGIGITPIFSILRSQMEMTPSRKIVLVWGLATKEDLLLIDELEKMRENNSNFSYHITISREQVEPYDFGRISLEYLQSIGVDRLFPEADFFICGPAGMMDSMKQILNKNDVQRGKIHIEEFSF